MVVRWRPILGDLLAKSNGPFTDINWLTIFGEILATDNGPFMDLAWLVVIGEMSATNNGPFSYDLLCLLRSSPLVERWLT